MGKPEDTRELLADTMKDLMPPRVELNRRQHHALMVLAEKTGKPLKDLVRLALERYLKDEGAKE